MRNSHLRGESLRTYALMTLAVANSVATANAAGVVAGNDPLGDTFGSPRIAHDIANLDAAISLTSVTFTIDFYGSVKPPSDFAAESLVGFLDIDLDQNPLTGSAEKASEFHPTAEKRLGAEVLVDLFSERFTPGQADVISTASGQPVGSAAVTYGDASVSVVVPLGLLNRSTAFDYGLIVGDFLDMSDDAFSTTIPEPQAVTILLVGALLSGCKRKKRW